jgi:hypothetical protein
VWQIDTWSVHQSLKFRTWLRRTTQQLCWTLYLEGAQACFSLVMLKCSEFSSIH